MDDETLQLQADETSALVLRGDTIAAIKDAESYKTAAAVRAELKTRIEWFETFLRPDIQKADQLHKSLLSKLKQLTDTPRRLYQRIGLLLSEFDRRAQLEKERLEREAEYKRKEAEAEQKRLAELAADLGSPQQVVDEIQFAEVEPAPIIKKEVPQVEGLYYRSGGWAWAIENRDLIPDEYWIVDDKAIKAVVDRLGKQAEKIIPGIVVTEKPRIPVQPTK